jgi:glucuronate isomerase
MVTIDKRMVFMKTDKKLFLSLKEFVDSIPMIDIHSHIDCRHPHAKGPRDILFYHYIATELRSAGMPPDAITPSLPAEEAVKNALPYFQLIKNTSTHWCLMQMLKTLYGFKHAEINKESWNGLLEAIREGVEQNERYKWVLAEKAKIKKTFLTFRYDEEMPQYDPEYFVGALRLDPLISQLSKDNIQSLEKSVSTSIGSVDDFADALSRLFKKFSRCAAATASFQPEEIFTKPSRAEVKKPFKKLLDKTDLTPNERQTVSSYAFRQILDLVEKSRFVFQIMIGAKRPVAGAAPPDYAITGFETTTVSSFCPLFHEFSGLKFDVFTTSQILSHEVTVVAKNYPNVHVSGYWWYVFYPMYIKQFLRERLQMLPRNKLNGFFSDAYVVEWSSAKSAMVRLQIATVLTEMVAEGYVSEALAKELAEDLLARNPERLYRLK